MEKTEIQKFCPICQKTLFRIFVDHIEFQQCEHYVWYSDLGSITNDEIRLKGGLKLRLLKR